MPTERHRAEDFLELVERTRLGRLKIYLGYAAGVGKTYQMLREAHTLKKRGVDVVLGYIEPHGRDDTTRLIEGLEVVPRKKIEYRGVLIEEMDLESVLARKPQVAIVDEVAHTNVPGSRNKRRYQDILEIQAAGINVICAFNIQHLESLNDLVGRSTGVTVRETVPDTFLKQADQIITLDLAVEDLLDRLKSGKIYAQEKIPWALEHFFKDENLSTLRELVLREVAESLDRQVSSKIQEQRTAATNPSGGRVMVCTASYSPRARMLLRRGSRMAGRLNTHWFVVYVETPLEAPHLIDSEAQRRLAETMEMARELGAEVVRLKSEDPVSAMLDFARSHGVGHIILGRSRRSWWKQIIGRSPVHRLINEAEGFDVHIVSFEEEREQA
ncbi:MAG: universal stress protein [Candidatus Sumerlaeota bacterium]|nr:universal stress protein [Candidatus Sumerlaeota bacterium]